MPWRRKHAPPDFSDPAPAIRLSPYGKQVSVRIKNKCDNPGTSRHPT